MHSSNVALGIFFREDEIITSFNMPHLQKTWVPISVTEEGISASKKKSNNSNLILLMDLLVK